MKRWISAVLAVGLAAALWPLEARQEKMTIRPALDGSERLAEWTLDGSGQWSISGRMLVLGKAGVPGGPIRRPAALAILKSAPFTTVTMELEIRSTAPVDLEVRDVNLVVGYESPSRFYYIHLSGRTDAVHNGIFVVADADRRRIDGGKSPPQLKDQAWHRVRVERDPSTGRIEVFVDDSGSPALQASDRTITAGRVGFGSFDETGEFRNIVVTGTTR